MAYDVRVIRMTKSTPHRSVGWYLQQDGLRNACVCLGHFDMMEIDELNAGHAAPLDAIQEDSWRLRGDDEAGDLQTEPAENSAYPLYVLKQMESPDGKKRLEEFWGLKTNFLAVSRFHCDETGQSAGQTAPFSGQLAERCKVPREKILGASEEGSDGYIRVAVRLDGGAEEDTVFVAFYDSLELGDIVGIAKSDSLSAILELQRHLYECEAVSDAYTHCGIDRTLLKENPLKEKREALEKRFLNYAATRFSVKNALLAHDFYDEHFTDESCYFVTGTADAMIHWGRRSEWQLVEIVRKLANAGEKLHDAFQDVITRIGVNYEKPVNPREAPLAKEPFENMIPGYRDILEILREDKTLRWRYPMAKLLGTLRSMYENSVMDGLSGLLVPGVGALLERICYLMKHDLWNEACDDDVFEFLERWDSLTSDVLHLESQMVQRPELMPVRYYIPAMVLQFEQVVVKKYAEIIKFLDQSAGGEGAIDGQRSFVPILFPSATNKNTNTECYLDPKEDAGYTGSSPLCIFLPVRQLYQPWKIAHILCHELAHYFGDYLRDRALRMDCLAESGAAYLLALWGLYLRNPNQDETIAAERDFLGRVKELIWSHYPGREERYYYLKAAGSMLSDAVLKVALSRKNQEEYQDLFLRPLPPDAQLKHIHAVCRQDTMDAGVTMEFMIREHVMNCLIPLYRECYADIFSILLLQCTFKDYYQYVYEDEYERLSRMETEDRIEGYEHHTDRMAIVILVVQSLMRGEWGPEERTGSDVWTVSALKKAAHWRSVADNPEKPGFRWLRIYLGNKVSVYSLLADEARQLQRYLESCGDLLQKQLKALDVETKESLDELRKCIKKARGEGFDWNELRRFLEDGLRSS